MIAQWLRRLANRLDPPPRMTIEEMQAKKTELLRSMLDHMHGTSGIRCPICQTVSPVDRWLP
jgi:LSD1 subclass zinc finger protein